MRLLRGVLRDRLGESLALLVLAVLAIAAAVATPLYAQAADGRAIEAELAAATPAERSIALQAPVVAGHADVIAGDLRDRARAVLHEPTLAEVTGVYSDAIGGVPLVARSDVCRHLVYEGRCPSQAGEVLAADGPIGRTITHGGLVLTVVGVYRPEGAARDPYWAGRSALTPLPQRQGNPLFTPMATFDAPELSSGQATYDLVAEPKSLTPQALSTLASELRSRPDFGFQVQSQLGLRSLVDRIETTRAGLSASLPLGAVEVFLLTWFVLLLTITYGTVRRRSVTALSTLRGAPTRYRFWLVLGPAVLILLAATPLGIGVGWLVARVPLTRLAFGSAFVTLLLVLVTAAIAAWRAQSVPLLDALRQVPSRSSRGILVAEAVVAAVALAAIAQAWVQPGTGLALAGPIAWAVLAGLVVARLTRYAASTLGTALLGRGRLGAGLAALQLARRPGADRLVALMVVTVALAGQAVGAWNASQAHAHDEAIAQLGASRVVSVSAASRAALLSAVRQADPDGRWAMAAARYHDSSDLVGDVVGVDSPRLQAVTGRGGVADRLRPKVYDPMRSTAAELPLEFDLKQALPAPMPVTIALTGPGGEPIRASVEIPAGSGLEAVSASVPACARGAGCRLAWLSFGRSPNGIWVRRVGDLSGPALSLAARWRKSLDAGDETTVLIGQSEVAVRYAPTDVRLRSNDIRLCVADAPVPLPAIMAGDESVVDDGTVNSVPLFTGTQRPVQVVGASPSLPGAGAGGVLVDLELADRLSDSLDNVANLEVWLGSAAPSDADSRLRAAGLTVLGEETLAQRANSVRTRTDAGAADLRLAGGVLGVVLTILAMVVVAAGDRQRRVQELAALRVQGIGRATAARAIGGYGLMAAVAFPVGALIALLTSGRSGAVLASLAAVGIVLALASWAIRLRLKGELS